MLPDKVCQGGHLRGQARADVGAEVPENPSVLLAHGRSVVQEGVHVDHYTGQDLMCSATPTPARVVGMPSRSTSRTTFVLFVSVRGEGRSGRSGTTEFRGGGVMEGERDIEHERGPRDTKLGTYQGKGSSKKVQR